MHARFMSWSYLGLLAAFLGEIGARLPGVRFAPGVIVPGVVVMVAGAVLIQLRVPRILSRLASAPVILSPRQ
jgi:hypothetical protein